MDPIERAHALRTQHRSQRAALSASTQTHHAADLTQRLSALPVFTAAQHVAAYIAIRGEIDVGPLLQIAATKQKTVYLPILRGEAMHFAPWVPGEVLEKRGMGLLEPQADEAYWIEPASLDLVLAPLVVFDNTCQRIGQGGGYYDRTFAFRMMPNRTKPTLLGVAHDSQRVESLDPLPWDVPLDMIATNSALYSANGTEK